MAEIKLGNAFRVDIIESERGWGSKVNEVKYFDSEESAKNFCKEYNKCNTADTAPDWYMRADYCGKVR